MSVRHSSLGRVAAKCRLTRSAGVATRIRLGMRRPGRGSPHRPLSVMIELKIDQKRRGYFDRDPLFSRSLSIWSAGSAVTAEDL